MGTLSLRERKKRETRQRILDVSVEGKQASWRRRKPPFTRAEANFADVRALDSYETLFTEEMDVMDMGEFIVQLPDDVFQSIAAKADTQRCFFFSRFYFLLHFE